MVTIRDFVRADADAVGALVIAIQRYEFGLDVTFDDQPDLIDIDTHYRRGRGNFWVALICDAIVGTLGLIDIGLRHGVMRKLFVAKEFRGEPFCVANALLIALLRHAAAAGLQDLSVGTTADFVAAQRFYAKHGFGETSPRNLPANFPFTPIDARFFRRDLARLAAYQANLDPANRRTTEP